MTVVVVVVILTSLLYFLDSTYKAYHIVFPFLRMTYFPEHSTLQVLSGCRQWQDFLPSMTEYYPSVHACAWACHVFIRPSADVHSGSTHVLTTMNSAAKHSGQHASF